MLEQAISAFREYGFTPEQFGTAVLFSAQESSADDVGQRLVSILRNLNNDDEFELFDNIIEAIVSKTYDEILEDMENENSM